MQVRKKGILVYQLKRLNVLGTHLRDIGKELFQRPKDVCTDDVEIFVTDSGASCVQVIILFLNALFSKLQEPKPENYFWLENRNI